MSRHEKNTRSKSSEEGVSTLLEAERDLLHGGLLATFEKLQSQQDERYADLLQRQDMRFDQQDAILNQQNDVAHLLEQPLQRLGANFQTA